MEKPTVAIIGGGLSGLQAAHLLTRMDVDFQLFEARDRFGGRILSTSANGPLHDLGPSWFWPDFQPRMAALIAELGLNTFPQFTEGAMLIETSPSQAARRVRGYESGSPSMRIAGGVEHLTRAMAARLAAERITLNAQVREMQLHASGITLLIETAQGMTTRDFSHVITALPLRLLAQDIRFAPTLSPITLERWRETPTWMAPHAKYVALYHEPFWRDMGLSGMARSQAGPMVETHDATDTNAHAALFGFIGIAPNARQSLGQARLLEHCRLQLVRLFGDKAASPVAHFIKDWAADPLTATLRDHDAKPGHFSRGYAKAVEDAWSQHLIVAGTEASREHNGYMEGALDAAESAVEQLRAHRDHRKATRR